MKVKALILGYYGNKRRYEGDIFDIDEKLFSKRWMTKDLEVKSKAPAKLPKISDKDQPVI